MATNHPDAIRVTVDHRRFQLTSPAAVLVYARPDVEIRDLGRAVRELRHNDVPRTEWVLELYERYPELMDLERIEKEVHRR